MVTARNLQRWLHRLFPPRLGERWDYLGWQKLPPPTRITTVLLTLDVTPQVCAQALKRGVEVIICHHPLLFPSPRQVLKMTAKKSLWQQLKRHHVGVFALHTNFDNSPVGMNSYILQQLGVSAAHIQAAPHHLWHGMLPQTLTLQQLIARVKTLFGLSSINYYGKLQQRVQRLVVVAGAGGSAVRWITPHAEAVFITGELKWSERLVVQQRRLTTLVVGHEMENIFITIMRQHLQQLPLRVVMIPTANHFRYQ